MVRVDGYGWLDWGLGMVNGLVRYGYKKSCIILKVSKGIV